LYIFAAILFNTVHYLIMMHIFLLLAGFVLLIKGADWLVKGASALAKKYRVSDLAIGLTVVAFGTSAPELVVNVYSSMQNHQDIVFANVIGSNMFNLFAILGITGLITPLVVQSSTVWKEIPFSLFAMIVIFVLGNDLVTGGNKVLSRADAFVLLAFFGLFLYYIYRQMRSDRTETVAESRQLTALKITLFIVSGFAGLVFGGRMVVTNAIDLASALGVSEKIIGLTVVAAGTSLPELATSVVAAYRKNNDIAVGNIVGSNIFNIFFILGISSMIRPLNYNPAFNTDIYLVSAGTLLLFLAMLPGGKKRLDRCEAAVLLLVYVVYTIILIQ